MEEVILERLGRLEARVSALESGRVTASTNTANLLREMNEIIGNTTSTRINTRPTRVNTQINANLRKTFRKVAKPISNTNYQHTPRQKPKAIKRLPENNLYEFIHLGVPYYKTPRNYVYSIINTNIGLNLKYVGKLNPKTQTINASYPAPKLTII